MSFWDLFQWWNLIFALPFCIGLIPLLLQVFGFAHSTGHGFHLGHLHHGHIPHIAHTPSGHAVSGHDASSSAHASGHSAQGKGHGIFSRLFTGRGMGNVPVMLAVSIFCFIWGASGIAANQVFSRILRVPGLYVWPSVACALMFTYTVTRAVTRAIVRAVPQLETYGTNEVLLVGCTARAAYQFDQKPGSAFLVDDQQNRVQVRCRSYDGSVIPRGADVVLLEYDSESRIFTVAPLEVEKDMPAGDPPQMQNQNRIQDRS